MRRRDFIKKTLVGVTGLSMIGLGMKAINIKENNDNNNYEMGKYLLSKLTINITDHCNLNCKSCDTFSPLASPFYLNPQKLKSDLECFCKIVESNSIKKIGLMGGEPLLNKNLSYIINICRFYFPETVILLVTNGILLKEMNNYFWEILRKNNIILSVSVYPINIDFKEIKDLADSNGIKVYFNKIKYDGNTYDYVTKNKLKGDNKFIFPDNIEYSEMIWQKPLLDLKGKQNPKVSFNKCHNKKLVYTMLVNGKIYCCYMASQIHHFNNFFNTNLKITNKDFLDIYKVKKIEEIWDFLETPPQFCRNCKYAHYDEIEWDFSQKDIKEWS